MNAMIPTPRPDLEARYKLFNALLDASLRKYHPDIYRGPNANAAASLTRSLLYAKESLRRTYEFLRDQQP